MNALHFFVGLLVGWAICNLTWHERKLKRAESEALAALDRIEHGGKQ